ncbi:hypothetical protein, partial [Enterobacter roggenkampii]|uniref:hypothetical protein n=1 Tax=Enterobacter roggenkampii TaxID=1812935 RepID=UPI0020760206
MSEVTTDLVWYPPEFPAQGRLPSQATLVGKNCRQQESRERAYRTLYTILCKCLFSEVTVQAVTELDNK